MKKDKLMSLDISIDLCLSSELSDEELKIREIILNKLKGNVYNPLQIDTNDKGIIDLYARFGELVDYNEEYMMIARKGLEDIEKYKFEEDSSINKNASMDTEHLRRNFSTAFAWLENINLKEHTLRVFRIAIEEGEEKGNISKLAILACLFHDFGKSAMLREKLLGMESSKTYRKHAAVSKIYIEEELALLFKDYIETINRISFLVENHHPSNNRLKMNEDILFIINVDIEARKEEIGILRNELYKSRSIKK